MLKGGQSVPSGLRTDDSKKAELAKKQRKTVAYDHS
jgi:hypothetical protein